MGIHERWTSRFARRAVRGGRSRVYVLGILVLQLDCVSGEPILRRISKPPRPGRCTFEALISDAYHFSRFTVSVVLRRLRLYCFGDPATQPPRGLSPGACARVAPRVSRVPRLNQSDALGPRPTQSHCSDRLGSLHRDSVKIRRRSPRPTKSHARRFATGTQSCAALPGTLSFAANSKRVKRELETGQTQNLKIQA